MPSGCPPAASSPRARLTRTRAPESCAGWVVSSTPATTSQPIRPMMEDTGGAPDGAPPLFLPVSEGRGAPLALDIPAGVGYLMVAGQAGERTTRGATSFSALPRAVGFAERQEGR